jgi:hypothetical protein
MALQDSGRGSSYPQHRGRSVSGGSADSFTWRGDHDQAGGLNVATACHASLDDQRRRYIVARTAAELLSLLRERAAS